MISIYESTMWPPPLLTPYAGTITFHSAFDDVPSSILLLQSKRHLPHCSAAPKSRKNHKERERERNPKGPSPGSRIRGGFFRAASLEPPCKPICQTGYRQTKVSAHAVGSRLRIARKGTLYLKKKRKNQTETRHHSFAARISLTKNMKALFIITNGCCLPVPVPGTQDPA